MKRILIIAQAIEQQYINQLVDALGENVTWDVISGSELSGDRINWIKSPKHDPSSLKSRLWCWIKHYRFIKKWAKKQDQKYDLIYAVSNPPINSYIGLKLKEKFNAPFIYMNWDLYPQIIEATISSPIVKLPCKIWGHWNAKNYPLIDRIVTIGPQMAEMIRSSTKSDVKLSVISLGINPTELNPIHKQDNKFLLANNLVDKFIVLFSGKMGVGHNIELILQAASHFQDNPDVVFVFIGSGPKYHLIEEYIANNNPENVKLFPWQDRDMFPYSIACGDIAIVTEEKAVEGLALPSRVFSMMSCGEAIIGICGEKDDLYRIVMSNGIGECVIDNSPESLSELVETLRKDTVRLEQMKKNSRLLIENEYSIENSIKAYRDLINELIKV